MSMSYAIRNEINLQVVLWAIGGVLYRLPGIVRLVVAWLVWTAPALVVAAKVAGCMVVLGCALAAVVTWPLYVVGAFGLCVVAYVGCPR